MFHADEALKEVSLKLVEFSDPKFYMQFGMSNLSLVTCCMTSHYHAHACRRSLCMHATCDVTLVPMSCDLGPHVT